MSGGLRAAAVCALCMGTAWAEPGRLPLEKIIGISTTGNLIPFSGSDRMMLESPRGIFRVVDESGSDASFPIIQASVAEQWELSPDDSQLLVKSFMHSDPAYPTSTLTFYGVSDGATLHRFDDVYTEQPFVQTPQGGYVAYSNGLTITVVRSSDFTEVYHAPTADARHPFAFIESQDGKYLAIATESDLYVIEEDGFDVTFEYSENGNAIFGNAFAFDEDTDTIYGTRTDSTIFKIDLDTATASNVDFAPKGSVVNSLLVVDGDLRVLSGAREYGTPRPVPSPFPNLYQVGFTDTFTLEDAGSRNQLWEGTNAGSVTYYIGQFSPPPIAFPGNASADGRFVGETNEWVSIISVKSGQVDEFIYGNRLAFSSSGERLGIVEISRTQPYRTADGMISGFSLDLDLVTHAFDVPIKERNVVVLGGPADTFIGNDGKLASEPFQNIYDKDGNFLRQLEQSDNSSDLSLKSWIPGTNYIVADGDALRVWDGETGELLQELFAAQETRITLHSVARDGSRMVFGNLVNQSLEVRETAAIIDGVETGGLTIAPPPDALFRDATLSPAADFVYAVTHTNGSQTENHLIRYDANTGAELNAIVLPEFGEGNHTAMEYLDNGDLIFAYADNISYYDMTGGVNIYTTPGLHLVDSISDRRAQQVLRQTGPLLMTREGDFLAAYNADMKVALATADASTLVPAAYTLDESAVLLPADGILLQYGLGATKRATPLVDEFLYGINDVVNPDNNGDEVFDAADYVITAQR
ncbi:MAG: hypothetical protein ABI579_03255 [Candidatus Sumerlaeota bacterium]